MRSRYVLILSIALFAGLGSCKQDPGKAFSQRYAFISGPDSIFLSFDTTGQAVRGHLEYRQRVYSEPQIGPLRGHFNGDTLLGEFSFRSEGKDYIREVTFLRHENGFREGYGEVREVDGKLVFVSNFNLRFDPSVLLVPVE